MATKVTKGKGTGKKNTNKVKVGGALDKAHLVSSFSFCEVKKQQASVLFTAWDEEGDGRISQQHLIAIIYALFPPNNSLEEVTTNYSALTLYEIRRAFLLAAGRPLSAGQYVTLKDVLGVIDELWATTDVRERMVQGCLYHVFTVMANTDCLITRQGLLETCNRATGCSISKAAIDAIVQKYSVAYDTAGERKEADKYLDFDGFCRIMVPLLTN
ncbi:unnamed protein product [Trypanosoma congolense IL3000]|uniref:WGS project CAEQ00000000 data, annotated contig 183 n=1 Tax=Trypanosoma congolense (strain IL3000) TaxID=1068625 RepID=F9W981_TRYCI|nr:unnamed protein product [Trypanosoma congolense IL3000]